MRVIFSILLGAMTAVIAILLHQSMPPVGVIASLLFIYLSIWMIGRHFGGKRFKRWAALGWIAVMLRASTFGAGQELLVQGDAVGSALLFLGALAVFAAIAARV